MTSANEQAKSQRLAQEQQLVVDYGDSNLAAKLFGPNSPYVAAAAQNPESANALLNRQYAQELQNFDSTIDPSLVNSGYRVLQEGLMGQALQDALAQNTAKEQAGFQTAQDAYDQALASNQAAWQKALSDAYNQYTNLAIAQPPAGTPTPTAPPRTGVDVAPGQPGGPNAGGSSLPAAGKTNPILEMMSRRLGL